LSKKRNTNTAKESNSQKIIPDWTTIRETIDKIDDIECKNILRVSYLFGTDISELIRESIKQENTIKGNDFSTKSIEGEEALILGIPTARRGYKPRYVAVPLNPKCEQWSECILGYSEEKANKMLYNKVYRVLQEDIPKKYFKHCEWIPIRYPKKKKYEIRTSFTHKHFSEVREWELGLCHNFNEYDFKHFFGNFYNSDYNVYFRKLLNKSDFYNSDDVINAIEMKNAIFSPREKYFYKVYMDIQKMIKRYYINKKPPINKKIDTNVDYQKIPGSSGKIHKILQANIKKHLEEEKMSNQVFCEDSNLDVVDLTSGIVVECGHTEAGKLLDSFNNVFSGIKTIREFWVLQFYDELEKISSCYQFIKSQSYR